MASMLGLVPIAVAMFCRTDPSRMWLPRRASSLARAFALVVVSQSGCSLRPRGIQGESGEWISQRAVPQGYVVDPGLRSLRPKLMFRMTSRITSAGGDNGDPQQLSLHCAHHIYRRDGRSVTTPVWAASLGGKLYVVTSESTGKTKRIRVTDRVRFAPCTRNGRSILGEWQERRGRIVGDGTMHTIGSGTHAAVFFRPNAFPSPLARDASRASRLHRYERSVARASAPAEAANTE
jgi:PPOX class probable F420-dependent enzyme